MDWLQRINESIDYMETHFGSYDCEIHSFDDMEEFNMAYSSILKDNDNILIKASHAMKFADIVELLKEMFAFIRDFKDEVPGASPKDCGNYLDMNLGMANYLAKKYLDEVLDHIGPDRLVYPN